MTGRCSRCAALGRSSGPKFGCSAIFSITAAGRAELRDWLADPTATLPEIRDIALLKLFFGAHTDPAHLAALAENQRDAHAERVKVYEALEAVAGTDPASATLGLGIAWERAATAFWASIAEQPPGNRPPRKR